MNEAAVLVRHRRERHRLGSGRHVGRYVVVMHAIRSRMNAVARERSGNVRTPGRVAWTGPHVNGGRPHRFGESDVLRAVSDYP